MRYIRVNHDEIGKINRKNPVLVRVRAHERAYTHIMNTLYIYLNQLV